MKKNAKQEKRQRRHKRVRGKIYGTAFRPRLCVFRSNKHIYAQIIDDESGKTLAVSNDSELKKKKEPAGSAKGEKTKVFHDEKKKDEQKRAKNIAIAYEVGELIAKKSLAKKIEKVVFDRGGYKYHGKIKAIAEGARSAGLKF